MKDISAYISIGIVCFTVLFIMFFKNKRKYIFTFSFRGVVGCILILLGNYVFKSLGIECFVGINFITLLTCIFLGFPGVCALFFISLL